jgi:hypothetical protein
MLKRIEYLQPTATIQCVEGDGAGWDGVSATEPFPGDAGAAVPSGMYTPRLKQCSTRGCSNAALWYCDMCGECARAWRLRVERRLRRLEAPRGGRR